MLNVFTAAIVTDRVFLVDWPELIDFFHCPYYEWQLSRWNFSIPEGATKQRIQDDFKGTSFKARNISLVFAGVAVAIAVCLSVVRWQTVGLGALHRVSGGSAVRGARPAGPQMVFVWHSPVARDGPP